jgi:hypothetical protein
VAKIIAPSVCYIYRVARILSTGFSLQIKDFEKVLQLYLAKK